MHNNLHYGLSARCRYWLSKAAFFILATLPAPTLAKSFWCPSYFTVGDWYLTWNFDGPDDKIQGSATIESVGAELNYTVKNDKMEINAVSVSIDPSKLENLEGMSFKAKIYPAQVEDHPGRKGDDESLTYHLAAGTPPIAVEDEGTSWRGQQWVYFRGEQAVAVEEAMLRGQAYFMLVIESNKDGGHVGEGIQSGQNLAGARDAELAPIAKTEALMRARTCYGPDPNPPNLVRR